MRSTTLLLSSLLVLSCGLANAEVQTKVAQNNGSAPAQKPASLPYARLYKILDSLAEEGWTPVKAGLYIEESGKYQQALPESYIRKTKQAAIKAGLNPGESKFFITGAYKRGGEAVLEELGCVAVAQKIFKRGNRYITAEGYQFSRPVGAIAGYSFLRRGSTTVVKRGDGSSEDSRSISFWQDRYCFRIEGTSDNDDESKGVIKKFADLMSKVVVAHASPPRLLTSLPTLDRVRGSEKMVMGPVLARQYFAVPGIKSLMIDKAREAIVVDYQVNYPHRERLRVLLIDYGNRQLAEKAYVEFSAGLSELKRASKPEGMLSRLNRKIMGEEPEPVQGNRAIFKVNSRYLMCELKRGGTVAVISGARKRVSPGVLASQL